MGQYDIVTVSRVCEELCDQDFPVVSSQKYDAD